MARYLMHSKEGEKMYNTKEIQIETFHDKSELQSFIYQNNVVILDIKYIVENEKEHFLIVYK